MHNTMPKKPASPKAPANDSLAAMMTLPLVSAEGYLKEMVRRRDVRRKIEDLRDKASVAKELW